MSEANKHTPAPWNVHLLKSGTVEAPYTSAFAIISDAKRKAIVTANCQSGGNETMVIDPEFRHGSPEWLAGFYTPEEMEANARLIAAAPDLLDACSNASAFLGERPSDDKDTPYENGLRALIDQLQAALTKATTAA